IADILEGAYPGAPVPAEPLAGVAEETATYVRASPAALAKKIKQLEQAMYRHARDLEFEEAAKLRDEIQRIRDLALF
ncbi:MAG: UvrB/UvrC motif-containing protein, partial [Candidatus Competibacteraceae bacterium]|nr:UvrB/UvrC motif-containing protein [Candidatus Competibacteraceae bacterium]